MTTTSARLPSTRRAVAGAGRRRRGGAAFLSVLLGWLALASLGIAERREYPVGRTHADWVDDSRPDWNDATRPRPLAATLWYPAQRGTRMVRWQGGVFEFGEGAADAAIAEGAGRLPLVLVSHGTGGSAAQLSWLAESLASEGFLVAGVNHHGNTVAEKQALVSGFVLWWERARDLQVLLQRLLDDPFLGPHVDADRIGVAGFSLGGYTALLAAGARVDLEAFRSWCERHGNDGTCAPPPEAGVGEDGFAHFLDSDPRAQVPLRNAAGSFHIPQVRAAFVMAPAPTQGLSVDSLRDIHIPVDVVTGSGDALVRVELVQSLAQHLPDASLQVLRDVGHYAFLAPCAPEGVERLPLSCADAAGIDRSRLHREVAGRAAAFFRRHLCAIPPEAGPSASGPADTLEVDPCSTP